VRCGDAAVRRRRLPLFGVPFAAKDNIDVAGLPTTAACRAFRRIAEAHAHAIEKPIAPARSASARPTSTRLRPALSTRARRAAGRASSYAADRISGGSPSGSPANAAHGFVCEAHAVGGALGISAHGGGRAYLASLAAVAERAPDT
jgi:allophanate hydrolase